MKVSKVIQWFEWSNRYNDLNEATKLSVWKQYNNKIDIKGFLLVAGGNSDSASMEHKSHDADWDRRTGQDETALQVLCSVCSHSHAIRISCINSSVDFSLGTCS